MEYVSRLLIILLHIFVGNKAISIFLYFRCRKKILKMIHIPSPPLRCVDRRSKFIKGVIVMRDLSKCLILIYTRYSDNELTIRPMFFSDVCLKV